jgi:mannose/fructose-specific phosphotransferase system component IIA
VAHVVAGHGTFAAGIVSAVQQITGRGDRFVAVSNEGQGGAELEERLARVVDDAGAVVVFTDLPAGSCSLAARRLQRRVPGLLLVTGVNLPLLLDVAMAEAGDPAEVVRAALERGRQAMQATPPLAVTGG